MTRLGELNGDEKSLRARLYYIYYEPYISFSLFKLKGIELARPATHYTYASVQYLKSTQT